MSANTAELAQAIIDALQPFVTAEAPAKAKAKAKKEEVVTEEDHRPMALAGKKAEPEEEPEAEEVTEYSEGELKKLKIKELRELAISLDYDESEVKGASKAELIEAILAEQEEGDVEPADEDEEDEVEGEEEEESGYAGMSLAELKAEAKERGVDGRKMRNYDVDDVIALLEELDAEDEDEEDAEDAEEDDIYTEDELNEFSLSELKELAEEYELEIPKRTRRNTIVDMILEAQDEWLEEEEEDEEDED